MNWSCVSIDRGATRARRGTEGGTGRAGHGRAALTHHREKSPAMTRLQDHRDHRRKATPPWSSGGESGTGKGGCPTHPSALIVRAKPFVAVNCAAFPETLPRGRALRARGQRLDPGAVKRRAGGVSGGGGRNVVPSTRSPRSHPWHASLLPRTSGRRRRAARHQRGATQTNVRLPPRPIMKHQRADSGRAFPRGSLLSHQRPRRYDPPLRTTRFPAAGRIFPPKFTSAGRDLPGLSPRPGPRFPEALPSREMCAGLRGHRAGSSARPGKSASRPCRTTSRARTESFDSTGNSVSAPSRKQP